MVSSSQIESVDTVEMYQDGTSANPGKTSKSIVAKIIALTWFTLANAFNYATMQGIGYGFILYPALKQIFKNDPARLNHELIENSTFFNCNNSWTPLIIALHIKMLEAGASTKEAIMVKLSLMGPLAGIGDTLYSFTMVPVFTIIGVQFSQNGSAFGAILSVVALSLYFFAVMLSVTLLGLKMGEKIVDDLAQTMKTISLMASIIGITVIVGLSLTFVKFNLDISWTQAVGSGQKSNSIKEILDNVAPNLLPVTAISTYVALISKAKWSVIKVIMFTFVVAIVGATVGFITPA
ncbi:hypothetical protein SCLARK_001271 [Spiroplasma clarkii]|uniref:PTS system, N-acetylgalactosamine-specific IID component n=1 Tax=Spiroplasma clarkii TaxID=2139 RepID=A0A1Y0L1D7_9MOLU|nr:PTS system mannose/fructose/sorbose family transporter subunit IID [Spiroplasma clarkii]ARU91813.1 hypothetical protein SCLARK_001271 [Spiroplasma clarkii]ATX71177.1 PTS system, N-acetylgalactosamine-specific IID component [Spiroplasma clarkii]